MRITPATHNLAPVPLSLQQQLIRRLGWPAVFLVCVMSLSLGMHFESGPLAFSIAYVWLALTLFWMERQLPFAEEWLQDDGQMLPDLTHTVISKALAYYLVVAGGSLGLFTEADPGSTWWPDAWPMMAQIVLGLVIAEFGLYWAHRISHEWSLLWPFHAVHHSVKRLWFFNTGRFHLMDTFRSTALALPPLFVLGAPEFVFTWVSAVTAFIGLLTHCNIDFSTRSLHWVFNTPSLHRWHHSPNAREGNTNYGENLMLWDVIFKTYFDPADRQPPKVIGISEFMPRDYWGQVWMPFRWRSVQRAFALGRWDRGRAL